MDFTYSNCIMIHFSLSTQAEKVAHKSDIFPVSTLREALLHNEHTKVDVYHPDTKERCV